MHTYTKTLNDLLGAWSRRHFTALLLKYAKLHEKEFVSVEGVRVGRRNTWVCRSMTDKHISTY